ncbi:MAG: fibronectin type III-like domain-contianing protein, partial [Chitinophagaceae bacterium]|nr:fibronectin type III-like domain-contianing protein [Chitinophagaceae bacterium]
SKHTEEKREILNSDVTWDGYDPLFPFGHGLSYTSFSYGDIKLSAASMKGAQPLKVSVTVTNTGSRQGKHTVELYSRDVYASITPSVKRLRGFNKIDLKPGEARTVNFTITRDDLAFVNAQLKTVTEPGEFELMIGDKKVSFIYAD